MGNFIDDGQTQTGYIMAAPGVHESLAFQFRLMTTVEQSDASAAAATQGHGSAEAKEKVLAGRIAKKIDSWSESEPITADNLLRLKPLLYDKLSAIIMGSRPSDPAPDGQPSVHVTEEEQRGNSDAA